MRVVLNTRQTVPWQRNPGKMAPSRMCIVVLLTFFTASRQYELGALYKYAYTATLLLNEPQDLPMSTPRDVGFQIDLDVDVMPIWQNPTKSSEQILKLKVSRPKLSVKSRQGPTPSGFVQKSSNADRFREMPFYIRWDQGNVVEVFFPPKEPLSFVNIKKGIASLFQYKVMDTTVTELDTSGLCLVTYRAIDNTHLLKTKKSCWAPYITGTFNHTSKTLGASVKSERAVSYELISEDYAVRTATAVETHILHPTARKASASEAMAKQVLQLKGIKPSSGSPVSAATAPEAINYISQNIRSLLHSESLRTTLDEKECIACKTLKVLVADFRESLSPRNLGMQSSGVAYLRLLKKMRESSTEEIKSALTDRQNAKILPQLLDVVGGVQMMEGHRAARAVVVFREPIDLAERYLLALSLSTHPREEIIKDVFSILRRGIKNDKLYESTLLALASMVLTFSQIAPKDKQQVVDDFANFVLGSLSKCQNEKCKLLFIKAVKTADAKLLQVLLKFAKGEEKRVATAAMRVLQVIPSLQINDEVHRELEMILFELDGPHDSSVRGMAAEILLRLRLNLHTVTAIFNLMESRTDEELSTLLYNLMQDASVHNGAVRKLMAQASENVQLVNYNVLSRSGLSSVFTRTLAADNSANISFTNVLEINRSLLKRSTVDLYLETVGGKDKLLSFGIFAGGLSAFGSSELDDGDEEEANAGIEISLMNSQLRPFVFFSGQGELMGHVWSGTASERTTALQGMALLHDHYQVIPLQNGLTADIFLTGVVSYDFAGQIQISLWNRNAHSLVEVGAAIIIQGQIRVDSSFVQTMIEFNVGTQSQLDLISDLDFYDGIVMCLRMVQPDSEVVEVTRKLEHIPGSSYALRKYKRKTSLSAGRTHALNRKNTELCNIMFNK